VSSLVGRYRPSGVLVAKTFEPERARSVNRPSLCSGEHYLGWGFRPAEHPPIDFPPLSGAVIVRGLEAAMEKTPVRRQF